MFKSNNPLGRLELEDGSVFEGVSFASENNKSGEVVFNTGLVGYPETFTDPSYKGQIVVLTYPLIGNYGVPGDSSDKLNLISGSFSEDMSSRHRRRDGNAPMVLPLEGATRAPIIDKLFESSKIQISGLIISSLSEVASHWNSSKTLPEWLKEHDIPAIYGVDTRALTQKLRESGTMLGKIKVSNEEIDQFDPDKANLVAEVSCDSVEEYGDAGKKVVLVDCGCKNNIVHSLVDRGVKVIKVPWNYDFNQIDYDGLFISNGPGNPKMCEETVANIRKAFEKKKPIFGICLGNQLLALAAGADTYKLKYGHRSQNQPCQEFQGKRCFITSQNHGYAIDEKSLPKGWRPWFVNANDNTNEGMRHEELPFMSVQFHPEARPGPTDTRFLFDDFVSMLT